MDAQAAAERATTTILRGPCLSIRQTAAIILAEFAPLLAAKDEEISTLKGWYDRCVGSRYQDTYDDAVKFSEMKADRDRLAAEVAELRRDAERYRHLRTLVIEDMDDAILSFPYEMGERVDMAEALDDAVDAALAAQK